MAMVLGIGGTSHLNQLQSESSLKFRVQHLFFNQNVLLHGQERQAIHALYWMTWGLSLFERGWHKLCLTLLKIIENNLDRIFNFL